MKKLLTLFTLCILLLSTKAQSEAIARFIEGLIDRNVPNQTYEEKEYTVNCIKDGIDEIKGLVKLAKDIVVDVGSEQYELLVEDAIKDGIPFIKGAIKLVTECKALFCYGPSKQKCESENSQGCDKNGLIYYPKCKEGYTNFGCCVCATECPSGFTDNGLYCLKPRPYGRGAGYVIWDGDKCRRRHSQGCEKNGLMWYPKCKPGFHNVGCCICSPDCPSGFTDIGISCKKPHSYGRGVGYPVSVGQQCLKENLHSDNGTDCDFQGKAITYLRETVHSKIGSDYEGKFGAEVGVLAKLVDKHHKECHKKIE